MIPNLDFGWLATPPPETSWIQVGAHWFTDYTLTHVTDHYSDAIPSSGAGMHGPGRSEYMAAASAALYEDSGSPAALNQHLDEMSQFYQQCNYNSYYFNSYLHCNKTDQNRADSLRICEPLNLPMCSHHVKVNAPPCSSDCGCVILQYNNHQTMRGKTARHCGCSRSQRCGSGEWRWRWGDLPTSMS